jgi:hypothetical protein
MSRIVNSLPGGVKMSDFRRRIEQGLGDRSREEARRQELEKTESLNRSLKYAEIQKHEAEQIVLADQHFDRFLLPIFTDVAAAKNIPLRDSDGRLFKKGGHDVNRSGFYRRAIRESFKFDPNSSVYTKAELCWDLQFFDRITNKLDYSYLEIGVTASGLLVTDYGYMYSLMGVSLLESGTVGALNSLVEELIVNSNGLKASSRTSSYPSSDGAP